MSIETSINMEANAQQIMDLYVKTTQLEKAAELAHDKKNLADDNTFLGSNAVVYDRPKEYDPFENSSRIKTIIK